MIKKILRKNTNINEVVNEGLCYDTNALRQKRRELYSVLNIHAEGDKDIICKMYNNLYELYFLKTKNNLPRLAQTAGYTRVVEYAEAFGHIDALLLIAKIIYAKEEYTDV